MDSIITFEERYRQDMQQRRERPFSTLPVYRFQWSCPVCKADVNPSWGHSGTEECRKAGLTEKIVRSYPKAH